MSDLQNALGDVIETIEVGNYTTAYGFLSQKYSPYDGFKVLGLDLKVDIANNLMLYLRMREPHVAILKRSNNIKKLKLFTFDRVTKDRVFALVIYSRYILLENSKIKRSELDRILKLPALYKLEPVIVRPVKTSTGRVLHHEIDIDRNPVSETWLKYLRVFIVWYKDLDEDERKDLNKINTTPEKHFLNVYKLHKMMMTRKLDEDEEKELDMEVMDIFYKGNVEEKVFDQDSALMWFLKNTSLNKGPMEELSKKD